MEYQLKLKRMIITTSLKYYLERDILYKNVLPTMKLIIFICVFRLFFQCGRVFVGNKVKVSTKLFLSNHQI